MTPQEQRELLELAAYAMQQTGDRNFANYEVVDHAVCLELGCRRGAITSYWNSLTNKADAFDLMVKLHMAVEISHRKLVWAASEDLQSTIEIKFEESKNPETSTMLAITRAAAAIGKQMKARNENAE